MDAAAAVAAVAFDRRVRLLVVTALPVVAECAQSLLPGLGRAGFLLPDVLANWRGVGAGVAVGSGAALVLLPIRRRRAPTSGTPRAAAR